MSYDMEPMLELFIYETNQIIDNLEKTCIDVEDIGTYTSEAIDEIFRGMHTIKGSSGMMMYDSMSKLSHALEDLFDLLRSNKSVTYDERIVTDLTLDTLDFIKTEMEGIEGGSAKNSDVTERIHTIKAYIAYLKEEPQEALENPIVEVPIANHYYMASEPEPILGQRFGIRIFYSDDCVMENVRSFTLMNNVKEMCITLIESPTNLLEADEVTVTKIKEEGFYMDVTSLEDKAAFDAYLTGYPYVKGFEVEVLSSKPITDLSVNDEDFMEILQVLENVVPEDVIVEEVEEVKLSEPKNKDLTSKANQNMTMISVNVSKLDKLMDLVGELVVSEAMVTRNDLVASIMNESMNKAIRQHRKLITDMQDIALSIRMVPLSGTFQKMKRIVRDASKNLDKKMTLQLVGENTEADKNIIERISDPLMHLIRNACDHGIESPEERRLKGKDEVGVITLEAKNSGGDVVLVVKDDGKGLDADRIYQKVIEKNLLSKDQIRPSDEELYNYIFMAGFSTKEEVSAYSGRGVGMDVVTKNIEKIGGSISVTSEKNKGSKVVIKIPLTLTIVEGMRLRVGKSEFILPITAIQESFRVKPENYVMDPEGNEIILIRGKSYGMLRLHSFYGIEPKTKEVTEGIVIFIGDEDQKMCLFADELVGEQQVVVKPLPKYMKKVDGVTGCAILGDSGISLILDMDGLLKIL